MSLDVELLSRIQFALTVMFHYLFPPLTIGLAWLMVFAEARYLRTRDPAYEAIARFWTKIFAVNFAMGVATGIVMEFQFGTNWSAYARFVGDVFGSALAAEGIFAFFLESGFLAVLVFGWDRVSPRMHFIATLLVALGSSFSAIWIVVANSWQQTPAGHSIVGDGAAARAEVIDFWAVVFNPSSMHRLNHVIIGAFMAAGFFVVSISAYYLLKGRHGDFAKKSIKIGLAAALVASLAAPISGHFQAGGVAVNQPAKLAAFEGVLTSRDGGAPLWLFGVTREEEGRVYGIPIPGLLSFLVHHDVNAPVRALDTFPPEDRPPVAIAFQSYHLMVLCGLACIALAGAGVVALRRERLFGNRTLLWLLVFGVIAPYVANQAGWVAAETGRQPWIVYGILRTKDALSPSVSGGQVLGSIIMFSCIYGLLLLIWLYVMDDKIRSGPELPGPRAAGAGRFLDAAAQRTDPSSRGSTSEPKARE